MKLLLTLLLVFAGKSKPSTTVELPGLDKPAAAKEVKAEPEPRDPALPNFDCKTATGEDVEIRVDERVKQIAIAFLGPKGSPQIKYNPKGVAWVTDKTRLFVLAHECAHHTLSHLYTEMNVGKEQQADCWALATLQQRDLIGSDDISDIQRDVAAIAKGDSTHVSGAQRANNLQWCPRDPTVLEKPAKEGLPEICCTKRGRLGPYPNLSAPVGAPCIGFTEDGAMTEGKLCK